MTGLIVERTDEIASMAGKAYECPTASTLDGDLFAPLSDVRCKEPTT